MDSETKLFYICLCKDNYTFNKEEEQITHIFLKKKKYTKSNTKMIFFYTQNKDLMKVSELREELETKFKEFEDHDWLQKYGDLKDGKFKFIRVGPARSINERSLESYYTILDVADIRSGESYIYIRRE